MTKIIKTKYGELTVKDLSETLLHDLQTQLPYGFYPFSQEYNRAKFGFVVKCEGHEVPCLKQQTADMSKEAAVRLLNLHHCLILETYVKLIGKGFSGIYYATPYFKAKPDQRIETGIAHYIFPSTISGQLVDSGAYDRWMGAGCTNLFLEFMNYYQQNFNEEFRIPYIGVDCRTRSQLGGLVSGFMFFNDTIIYLGAELSDNDMRFSILAQTGIKEICHAPALPMEIKGNQLIRAKGKEN